MHAEVEAATESLRDPVNWQRYLEATKRFGHFGLDNTLLILAQKPDAAQVASACDWEDNFGRSVNTGARAIWVLAPCRYSQAGPTGRADTVDMVPVAVFDISQTVPR